MSDKLQLRFPAYRYWRKQMGPPYPGYYALERWMVWKGYAPTEAEAAVMVGTVATHFYYGPSLLDQPDATVETRWLDHVDRCFDAAAVIRAAFSHVERVYADDDC